MLVCVVSHSEATVTRRGEFHTSRLSTFIADTVGCVCSAALLLPPLASCCELRHLPHSWAVADCRAPEILCSTVNSGAGFARRLKTLTVTPRIEASAFVWRFSEHLTPLPLESHTRAPPCVRVSADQLLVV